MRSTILVLALCLASGGALAQSPEPAKVADTAKGKVLADPRGMTLYTFDRDTAGTSACTAQCAQNWPPLAAPADATASANWTIVARQDGGRQWAYKGKPLYGWTKDTKAGDTTGDGVNNVWHVATP